MTSASTDVALGIDIGGSNVALGLVDPVGHPVQIDRIATEAWPDLLTRARASADRMVDRARQLDLKVVGVGIGVPRLVDRAGEVVDDAGVGWSSEGLRGAFGFAGPVWIEADVRAGALGEAMFGAGVGVDDWLYVNLGTGISHCMVQRGRPVPGANGRAILSGSTTMSVLDEATGRIVHGRVEDVASGRGLVERYRRGTGRDMEARGVLDLAAAGDPLAIQLRDDMVDLLGGAVANLVDLLDPTRVVIGGGLATIPLVFDGVVARARSSIWFEGGRDIPVVRATLGADSGIVGAAALVWSPGRTRSPAL